MGKAWADLDWLEMVLSHSPTATYTLYDIDNIQIQEALLQDLRPVTCQLTIQEGKKEREEEELEEGKKGTETGMTSTEKIPDNFSNSHRCR